MMNFQMMAPPPLQFQPRGWEAPQMEMPQMPEFNMEMPNLDSWFNMAAPQQEQAQPEKKCEINEDDTLDVLEFERQLFGGMYKSTVKGFWRSSKHLISDECMGDWMKTSFDGLYAYMEKFNEDPFSVTMEESTKVADDFIAMIYKNVEVCQVEKVYDNYNSWCADNKSVCDGTDEVSMQRIMDNGMDIIAAGYDMFTALFNSDDCMTDQQTIDMINKMYEDMMKIVSVIYGFDAKWNDKVQKLM